MRTIKILKSALPLPEWIQEWMELIVKELNNVFTVVWWDYDGIVIPAVAVKQLDFLDDDYQAQPLVEKKAPPINPTTNTPKIENKKEQFLEKLKGFKEEFLSKVDDDIFRKLFRNEVDHATDKYLS